MTRPCFKGFKGSCRAQVVASSGTYPCARARCACRATMSKRERKKAEEKDRKEAELAAVTALQRASDEEKATNETAAAEKRRLVCSLGMQKALGRLRACLSALAPDG